MGKLFTRLASMFPENPFNKTDDYVDEAHEGLFVSVFQSIVPPLGRFGIREASKISRKGQ